MAIIKFDRLGHERYSSLVDYITKYSQKPHLVHTGENSISPIFKLKNIESVRDIPPIYEGVEVELISTNRLSSEDRGKVNTVLKGLVDLIAPPN